MIKFIASFFSLPKQEDDGQSSASGNTTPAITLAELRTSEEDIPQDLYEAARREKKLKSRIQELVDTLEKLSKNSEIRLELIFFTVCYFFFYF